MRPSAFTGKRRKKIAFATALIGTAVLLTARFTGWTGPSSARNGSVRRELAEMKRKAGDAEALLGQEASIWRELDRSVAELEALMAHAPSFDRHAWAYEYVSRCAAQSRVILDHFEETGSDSGDRTEIPGSPYEVRISTRCSYNALVHFLRQMEENNPLIRISQVTVSAQDDPEAHRVQIIAQWRISLEIERYTPSQFLKTGSN